MVNGKYCLTPVVRPEEPYGAYDLIIVAQENKLAEVVPGLTKLVGHQTAVISATIGLDSQELLGYVTDLNCYKYFYLVKICIDYLEPMMYTNLEA